MSAGLFAIYHFGGGIDLYPFLYYGLKAMSNRGDVAVAYVYNNGEIRRLEVDLSREGEGSAPGVAAVGCVYVEDCCKEVDGGVICKFGKEEPAPGERPSATAYVALTKDGAVYAYRPPKLWHLAVGAHGFDFAIIATEAAVVEVLGGEVRRSLLWGELLKIHSFGVESTGGGEAGELCALEILYASRLDNVIDGVEVAEARAKLAEALAEKASAEVDVVIGVPETGMFYASALARRLGVWSPPAFVATARGRSALLDEVKERLAVIQLKANVVKTVVKGKRVMLVDDSVISGITIRQMAQMLRGKAGAREVHVAVASPPLRRSCPYGVKTPPESHMIYNHLTPSEVAEALEVDSIVHLEAEEVEKAVGKRLCTLCLRPPLDK